MSVTRKRLAGSAVGAVVSLLALTGCGSGDDGGAAVPKTATGTLEHIAGEVGCKPDMQTDADTIRQALCTNKDGDFDGKFVLATFATDRGQAEWLAGAKDYGGYYLVGRKWVAVGEKKTVAGLQGTLGGDVQEGSEHMNPGGSHNDSGSHSGGGHSG
ncbi:hypothetical protein [Streptomyces neyagawaensis]|uniref:hypothetical protein n=1 Tax=Streptomyces neyagawaensis TaxID=42238 RepID=UPI00201CCFF6|nr:hypothetical protein [Streptomyces neyagawaensis]MCL6732614.1 hypothetical protein [Streptomyces neyagawaensis]MDE1681616.1 hypothetical protein [Streptomyces neyagawaensis]